MIAHVVIATWKSGVTSEQIRRVKTDLLALTARIPDIARVDWWESLSSEVGELGVAVVIHAKNDEAIDAYHALPEHVPFAEMVTSVVSSLTGGSYRQ